MFPDSLLDLVSLGMRLADFWPIARQHGCAPIISQPEVRASEAWHFDCRGSHGLVYQYYKQGKGNNYERPYQVMAASAMLAIEVQVGKFKKNQIAASLRFPAARSRGRYPSPSLKHARKAKLLAARSAWRAEPRAQAASGDWFKRLSLAAAMTLSAASCLG